MLSKISFIGLLLVTATVAAVPAHARGPHLNLVLAGGSGPDEIHVALSKDGRSYLIESATPMEVGGDVCSNPPGSPDELVCNAGVIAGIWFSGGDGNDEVIVGPEVPVPVTLRGGPGNDTLVGGAGDDKLMGGPGNDLLIGRGGNDALYGGSGNDRLVGGPGTDVCVGGSGYDTARTCEKLREVP